MTDSPGQTEQADLERQAIVDKCSAFMTLLLQEQRVCQQQYNQATGDEKSTLLGTWAVYDYLCNFLWRIMKLARYDDPLPALQKEVDFLKRHDFYRNVPDVFAAARNRKYAALGERLATLLAKEENEHG